MPKKTPPFNVLNGGVFLIFFLSREELSRIPPDYKSSSGGRYTARVRNGRVLSVFAYAQVCSPGRDRNTRPAPPGFVNGTILPIHSRKPSLQGHAPKLHKQEGFLRRTATESLSQAGGDYFSRKIQTNPPLPANDTWYRCSGRIRSQTCQS